MDEIVNETCFGPPSNICVDYLLGLQPTWSRLVVCSLVLCFSQIITGAGHT